MFLLEFHPSERRQSAAIVWFILENLVKVERCSVVISRIQIQEAEPVVRFALRGVQCDRPLKLRARLLRSPQPHKRNAQPVEVARAIDFLLSDGADYINGIELPVAGGSVF